MCVAPNLVGPSKNRLTRVDGPYPVPDLFHFRVLSVGDPDSDLTWHYRGSYLTRHPVLSHSPLFSIPPFKPCRATITSLPFDFLLSSCCGLKLTLSWCISSTALILRSYLTTPSAPCPLAHPPRTAPFGLASPYPPRFDPRPPTSYSPCAPRLNALSCRARYFIQ